MGEQAKQDLDLLRKARYEVQKLEEIHEKIRKEEQEIREYGEEKEDGVWYDERPTDNEKEMRETFSENNRCERIKKMDKMVKCARVLLIVLWLVSFVVVSFTLPKDFWPTTPYCVYFWLGNITAFIGFGYIFRFYKY